MVSRKKNLVKKSKRSPARKKSPRRRKLSAGAWFEKLVALQARLRAPDGCPWDREQTHATLRTYLVEEAYEVLDALESGGDAKFAEEMGDLLLQIVFHSQIASESGRFTVADVIREVYEKMVRRHPHVFGKQRAKDANEVLKHWEQIKREERRSKVTPATSQREETAESLMDGVPRGLPALMEGFQLTRRAARVGFDWGDIAGIFDKLFEEASELRQALAGGDAQRIESEVGDILFVVGNLARFLHIDPEIAMKKANAKFSSRFRAMERLAKSSGTTFSSVPRPEMESLWDAAKQSESQHQHSEAAHKR
jgi:tetrapyrrole methylase family protein / MazG family protein